MTETELQDIIKRLEELEAWRRSCSVPGVVSDPSPTCDVVLDPTSTANPDFRVDLKTPRGETIRSNINSDICQTMGQAATPGANWTPGVLNDAERSDDAK